MNGLRRAFVLALTTILGGCIVFIDPIEAGEHCGIQGSGECTTCLVEKCQTAIDGCCGSTPCTGTTILGEIDACGRGELTACAGTLAKGRLSTEEEAVRACAAASCKTECTQGVAPEASSTLQKWSCDMTRSTPNECATCIFGTCADLVDTCCADATCKNDSTIKDDMGACLSGDKRGCAYLLDDGRGTSGQMGVLRGCIDKRCGAQCFPADRLPHTTCTLYDQGAYCQCYDSERSGTTTCREDPARGTDCVLGKGGCTCGKYECHESSIGCACSFKGGTVSSGTTCFAQSDRVCCATLDEYAVSCECGSFSCSTTLREVEVPSCDRDEILARSAVVTQCSR